MENSSDGPLRVPGMGDIPLDKGLPITDRFAHGFCEWEQVPTVTQREFTMVAVMNDLTDKPDWQTGIFRQERVDHWRGDIFAARPLMSDRAWEWCVSELRDKAGYYSTHGFIHVLDTGSRVCKSDALVSPKLLAEIRGACQSLLPTQAEGQSCTNGVVSLIDPSLYPLVWGRSLIRDDGGHSTVTQAPAHEDKRTGIGNVQERMDTALRGAYPEPWHYAFEEEDRSEYSAYFWSYRHQWLPAEIEFSEAEGTAMRFTSYINGLDQDNKTLDRPLAELVSACIAPWNDCLIEGRAGWDEDWDYLPESPALGWAPPGNVRPQRGRTPCRIITYGPQWDNEAPEWIALFDQHRRKRVAKYMALKAEIEMIKSQKPPRDADAGSKKKHKLRLAVAEWALAHNKDQEVVGLEQLPEPTAEQWTMAKEYLERPEPGTDAPVVLPESWERSAGILLGRKTRRLIRLKHPEPGTAFSYEEWKNGTHGGKAIVDMVTDRPIRPDKPPASTPHEPYTISLEDKFRSQGLQVIVRADSITLDAGREKVAEFVGSSWSLAGQPNEHVVAIALLAYDVDNVTDVRVSFRQQTDIRENTYNYGQGGLHQEAATFSVFKMPAHTWFKASLEKALCDIFGFDEAEIAGHTPTFPMEMQELGSVALAKGRLIAFPNTMEHRIGPFSLQDESKKVGHVRWITLMLVDPHYRICSTRNVPSQQGDFSREEAAGYKRDMEKEHALADFARYREIGKFFFA
ncbi:uncharacterized protein B0I36DRAFT_300409 [Microdochium trichocladiopsis]|uniref:Uncharacterized protein n=1 Tax=Microdochium trichocladiopsis TaxID=1682393 RepID=A0A9P8XRF2_9PEZI|nr:uncharacterized protein B0I36DRAFT_300409 [Microdochium trichocladiopsis]KAH7009348.1 hypothetical protein B0I36DRAFT_300409 [Microdochium trichocladiopsis]